MTSDRRSAIRLALPMALAAMLAAREAAPHGWNIVVSSGGPGARKDAAAAYDFFRGNLVVFGGDDGTTVHNDTWVLSASGQWTQKGAAPPLLTARSKHAMVWKQQNGVVVLFGGIDGAGPKNDTWLWDGTTWSTGPSAPAQLQPRANMGLAYDPNRGTVVMFGGWNGSYFNDTWEYNGLQWLAGPAAPAGLTPRDSVAMTWDTALNKAVLFGGYDGASALDDLWEYDGVAWVQGPAAPPGLTARYSAAFAFDPRAAAAVLYGGTDGTTTFGETWELGAAGFVSGPTPCVPLGARADHAMAADNTNVLLFGGANGANVLNDAFTYSGARYDYLIGAGAGQPNPNRVAIFNAGGVATSTSFSAYAAGQWGANVAAGGIDGAVHDVLTGPGPGAVFGPQVRAFKRDGTALGKVNYFAYGTLKYGVNISAPALDADSYDEMLTTPGPGSVFGPHVRGWNYDNTAVGAISKVSFFAYSTLKFGANGRGGDVDGDSYDEILTGPGPGAIFGPQVRGFNFDGATVTAIAKINFNAFTTSGYGVNVAGGNPDPDAYDEIGCGTGPGPTFAGQLKGFNFDNGTIASLSGFDVPFGNAAYGARLAFGDTDGDAGEDVIAAAGPDPASDSTVKTWSYMGTFLFPSGNTFVAFPNPPLYYGANVAAGDFGL